MKFTEKFDTFVCIGDTITIDTGEFEITARIEFDDQSHIDDDDSHNVDQSVTGCNDEQQKKLLAARTAWSANEWFYCGVVLSVSRKGVTLDKYAASLWGIDCNYPGSDNAYLSEIADELLLEALNVARSVLRSLLSTEE